MKSNHESTKKHEVHEIENFVSVYFVSLCVLVVVFL